MTASDGANLRSAPDTGATVLIVVPANAAVAVVKADVPGADGGSRWIQGTYEGITGYLRTDVVSALRAG